MPEKLEELMREEILKFEREKLAQRGYKINDRRFLGIKEIIEKSEDYKRCESDYSDNFVVYSGAEHNGKPKLPNITILPHLTAGRDFFLGSTFGHQHTQRERGDNRQFQEIYEFLGYGAMLTRNILGTTLYILKPGEKVIVGTDDNMTLFNLNWDPLVTLDYANPEMNSANKDLEKRIGPLMNIKRWGASEASCIIFKINENFVREGIVKCSKDIKLGYQYWGSVIVGGENAKFLIGVGDTSLGEHIYRELKPKKMTEENKKEYEDLKRRRLGLTAAFFLERFIPYAEQFEKLGIQIKYNGNIPEDLEEEFSPPLLELALSQNKTLFDALGIN